jgi:hypothetical protein
MTGDVWEVEDCVGEEKEVLLVSSNDPRRSETRNSNRKRTSPKTLSFFFSLGSRLNHRSVL